MQTIEASSFSIDALKLVERPKPVPARNEILLRMRAASINYRDLAVLSGKYMPALPMPYVPLSDGCGVVEAVGEGVTRFAIGQRAIPLYTQGWHAGMPTVELRTKRTLGAPLPGVLQEYFCVPGDDAVAARCGGRSCGRGCFPRDQQRANKGEDGAQTGLLRRRGEEDRRQIAQRVAEAGAEAHPADPAPARQQGGNRDRHGTDGSTGHQRDDGRQRHRGGPGPERRRQGRGQKRKLKCDRPRSSPGGDESGRNPGGGHRAECDFFRKRRATCPAHQLDPRELGED